MAKGFERLGSRRGMDAPADPRAIAIGKLGELVSDMYLCTDESDMKRMWTSANRMMNKLNIDPVRVETIMKSKRIGALSTLANELSHGGSGAAKPAPAGAGVTPPTGDAVASPAQTTQPTPPAVAPTPEPASDPLSHDALKHAMRAFKKRLKLTRLDQESRLGHRAMTGGKKSDVMAILPPREIPRQVWDELVRQGKLRDAGGGFYEMHAE